MKPESIKMHEGLQDAGYRIQDSRWASGILHLASCILYFASCILYFASCILHPAKKSSSFDKLPTISLIRVDLAGVAQGTTWHITYYGKDTVVKKRQVDSILAVIDSSLSIYKPYSHIVAFNSSTTGITVDDHFRLVVEKSLETYYQTGGLFDIAILPIVEAWGFGAKSVDSLPDSTTILSLLTCVGSQYLKLDGYQLTKLKPCVRIDVNGIAQGYSVDLISNFLE